MAGAGRIIYEALSPMLTMALMILSGGALAKSGALPPGGMSTKALSLVTMNISLPCLIFGSMVAAFTPQNIAAFGPLVTIAIIYQLLGAAGAWVIREVFFVPKDFYYGIIVMGTFSNWGNLPTAVVQQMAKHTPFGAGDVDLGVAYIAIYVLVMNTSFFGLGAHKVCGWDFNDDAESRRETTMLRKRWRNRRRGATAPNNAAGHRSSEGDNGADSTVADEDIDPEAQPPQGVGERLVAMLDRHAPFSPSRADPNNLERSRSPAHSFTARMEATPRIPATMPLDEGSVERTALTLTGIPSCSKDHVLPQPSLASPALPGPGSARSARGGRRRLGRITRPRARALLRLVLDNTPPATWAVILGLPFSLVQPLKALFIPVPGWTGTRVPNAPDGNPPLHWLMAAIQYLGNIAVPAALILLGMSFARLSVPSRWRDLPLAAIAAVTVLKMILIPVFGVFVTQALRNGTSLFPPEDKSEWGAATAHYVACPSRNRARRPWSAGVGDR